MKIEDTTTPVLVLCCEIGGLGIFRSLGKLGIAVYGVDESKQCVAFHSRYCKQGWVKNYNPQQPDLYLEFLLQLGQKLGKPSLLIPTSDVMAEFVSVYQQKLSKFFVFQFISPQLIKQFISKKEMYHLAKQCQIPTPHTLFPQNTEELASTAKTLGFPVMLKAINGDILFKRHGLKMLIVQSYEELLAQYQKLEDFNQPNLMIQELIPGDDTQVYIFNGYFNKESDCLVAYTGHKIRQHPIHKGCASLGISTWIEDFAELNCQFMKQLGYFGILDIGYRLDPRDGLYKVLDINPRLGGAFRLFVSQNGMDVVRSLYLDLTNQKQPESSPLEGRRWLIEDYDIRASFNYFREGSLSFLTWLKSFHRVEETAWFDWRDPLPFLFLGLKSIKQTLRFLVKK